MGMTKNKMLSPLLWAILLIAGGVMVSVMLTGNTSDYDSEITSTLELTGTEGTRITGYYSRNGNRHRP